MRKTILARAIAALFRRLASPLNQSVEILPSAARTSSPADILFSNPECDAGTFIIDITVNAASLGITVAIGTKDRVSGKFVAILTSAALSAVATTTLKIGRGLTASANVVANDQLPKALCIRVTHADANVLTYSVSFQASGSR